MKYETINEFIFRRQKESLKKKKDNAYSNTFMAWVIFSIPIVNLLFWTVFLFVYYNKRKVKFANNKKNR